MTQSFFKIIQEYDLFGKILHRTTSGMAIAVQRDMKGQVADVVSIFSENNLGVTEKFYMCKYISPALPFSFLTYLRILMLNFKRAFIFWSRKNGKILTIKILNLFGYSLNSKDSLRDFFQNRRSAQWRLKK